MAAEYVFVHATGRFSTVSGDECKTIHTALIPAGSDASVLDTLRRWNGRDAIPENEAEEKVCWMLLGQDLPPGSRVAIPYAMGMSPGTLTLAPNELVTELIFLRVDHSLAMTFHPDPMHRKSLAEQRDLL